MREGKEISEEYNQLNIQKKAIREEWRQNDSSWKKSFNLDGKKKMSPWAHLLMTSFILIGILALLWYIPLVQSNMMGPELHNNMEYSCPNGDWSGNTSQMQQIGDGFGGVFLYCPLDGKLIGHMTHGMVPGVTK